MSRKPDWDRLPPSELAIMIAISARACATHLHQIKMLLSAAVGLLGAIAGRYLGWF